MNKSILLGLFLTSLFAFAQAEEDIYVGAGIGHASQKAHTDTIPYFEHMKNARVHYKNSAGGKIYMGYQPNENVALEFGYHYLNQSSIKAKLDAINYSQFKVKGQIFSIAVNGIAPLNDRFSLFGKVGAGAYLHRSYIDSGYKSEHSEAMKFVTPTSSTKLVPLLAVGAEVKLNKKNLALRGEYEHFGNPQITSKIKMTRMHSLSLGLKYTF